MKNPARIRIRRPTTGTEGFSAVELMISIAFFGILMLGFLTMVPLGVRSIDKGEMISIATSLAQDELERLKALPDTDPDRVAGNHNDPANPINGVYTRTWTVTDDVPVAGMQTILVGVAYSDHGIARNIQVTTYLVR